MAAAPMDTTAPLAHPHHMVMARALLVATVPTLSSHPVLHPVLLVTIVLLDHSLLRATEHVLVVTTVP